MFLSFKYIWFVFSALREDFPCLETMFTEHFRIIRMFRQFRSENRWRSGMPRSLLKDPPSLTYGPYAHAPPGPIRRSNGLPNRMPFDAAMEPRLDPGLLPVILRLMMAGQPIISLRSFHRTRPLQRFFQQILSSGIIDRDHMVGMIPVLCFP
jgi:hypothetical protein